MRSIGLAALAAVCACAGSRAREVSPPDYADDPAARSELLAPALDGFHAAYVLTWNGARIGSARERFHADASAAGGWRFEREEEVRVRRGGAEVTARLAIAIDTDDALVARTVVVERWAGGTRVRGEAIRLVDDTWRIEQGAQPARLVDGAAVPSTLVPLLVAGAGASPGEVFDAPVLVEGAGLALARLSVEVSADRRTAFARLATAAGDLRAEATLDERGYLASAGGATGVASRRASEADLDAPFDAPELVDSAAIAVDGSGSRSRENRLELRLEDVAAAPPVLAELDHQRVDADGAAWRVVVDPVAVRTGGDMTEVARRTHQVARKLDDDLGLVTFSPEEALAAGRGDCTAHAVLLRQELEEAGYEARLVTGFVLDAGALRRHRWVVVRAGRDWVAVDPMYDEVPASPAHLALAVHGATPDEMAFIDDVTFAGWQRARASLVR